MSPRTSRYPTWWLLALLALNLVLKLCWLGVNELAGDEPFTVYWAQRPISELFGMLRSENNPPLYFLLMHGWSLLVPLEPAWLRVPSAIFSALTVWPLFLLGRRLGGNKAGITAALLFTFSQHHYQFAHEVRAYPLLVLACTWAVWQLVHLADSPRHPSLRPASIIWLVAANTLATWAHYFGWLMVGLELVMAFSVASLRPGRAKMLATTVITIILNIPLLGILFSRAGSSLGQGTWVQPPSWEEPYNMLMRWSNAPVVAVLFLVIVAWGFARQRVSGNSLTLATLWCAVPLVAMFLGSFLFPVYVDRYLLFASIGYYLLVALALNLCKIPRVPAWVLPAGCVMAMFATFTPWRPSPIHPSRVAAQVESWSKGNTAVLIQPAWYSLTYAWAVSPHYFIGAAPVEMALKERGVWSVPGTVLPRLDSSTVTVIHVDAWASLTDPGHVVLHELRKIYQQTDSIEADKKVMVRRFEK